MKLWYVRQTLIGLVVALLLFAVINTAILTHASSDTTAFGVSSGHSDKYDAYYVKARQSLDEWLRLRGFTSVPVESVPGPHPTGLEMKTWYQGNYNDSRPFTVEVALETKKASGLTVHTLWDFRGMRWLQEKDRERVASFGKLISQWWNAYKTKTPMQW